MLLLTSQLLITFINEFRLYGFSFDRPLKTSCLYCFGGNAHCPVGTYCRSPVPGSSFLYFFALPVLIECKVPSIAVNMMFNMNSRSVDMFRAEKTKCGRVLPRRAPAASTPQRVNSREPEPSCVLLFSTTLYAIFIVSDDII